MKTILNFIKKNRNIILLIISFVFLTMLILGMTYAYFDLKTGGETESTMTIGGAEISASYNFNNVISIMDAIPGNTPIANKVFSVTYKNTSNDEQKIYLKTIIDSNTFNDKTNDGVLYYDIYSGSGNNYTKLVKEKTMFPTTTMSKEILAELTIPAKSSGTVNYRINLYFPESTKFQNKNGQLSLSAVIAIESDNSLTYTPTAANFLKVLYNSDASTYGLEIDDTPDNNLRFTGSNARNYVMFNDETWRIIGIFNQIDANTNYSKQVVKIVNDSSVYNVPWDENGESNWNTSSLKKLLDEEYYESISSPYKNMILKTIWNTGSIDENDESSVKGAYLSERGTATWSGYDYLSTGYIAIPYLSDYGYASITEACRAKFNSCTLSDDTWMTKYLNAWLLTTFVGYDNAATTVYKDSITFDDNGWEGPIFPTLYLNDNVRIVDGDGTSDNPFILSK